LALIYKTPTLDFNGSNTKLWLGLVKHSNTNNTNSQLWCNQTVV